MRPRLRGEAEVRARGHDLADGALGQQALEFDHRRHESHPHRLHQEDALAARQRHRGLGLAPVHRERLLAQHRLAGLERERHRRRVIGMRRADVDDARADGDEPGVRHVRQRLRKQVADAAGADQAPADTGGR